MATSLLKLERACMDFHKPELFPISTSWSTFIPQDNTKTSTNLVCSLENGAHHFLPCRWHLWHQIWRKITRRPSDVYDPHSICNYYWLDWDQVCWFHNDMEPPEPQSWYFLTRICWTCTPQVLVPHLSRKTTCISCLFYPNIWYHILANYRCWHISPY